MSRLTNEAWRNFDPWECCGQDKYCKRDCHEEGGCANGCIVPKLYAKLAKYEDIAESPEDVQKVKHTKNIAEDYDDCDQFVCKNCLLELQGWTRVERDEDTGEETHYMYSLKYCPNCGAKMEEQ